MTSISDPQRQRSLAQSLGVFWRGLLMGIAEVVPGVSGGTIAFITGIYFELLSALREFHPGLLRTLFRDGPMAAFRQVHGAFLMTLAAGMGVAVLTIAHLVEYLLTAWPIGVWAFFFGLILASLPMLWREVTPGHMPSLAGAVLGLMVGLYLAQVEPFGSGGGPIWIFAGGAIAISAWVLPGVSGSFMLLLLGLYLPTLAAIKTFDWIYLLTLGAGCAAGLLSFVHLLGWLVENHRSTVLATMTGVMAGSLWRLWPWQQIVAYQIGEDGRRYPVLQKPLLPEQFTETTGEPALLLIALLAAAGGITAVFLLNWLGRHEDAQRDDHQHGDRAS